MNCFPSSTSIMLYIVLALSAVGSVRADEALPSQDYALARALENHPDIVAAKARVALAEAELYGKRMDVSRQVLGLYGGLKKLELQTIVSKAALAQAQAELERIKSVVASGKPEQSIKNKVAVEVQTAEAELVHTTNQREQVEKELRLLLSTASSATGAQPHISSTAVARQMPQGPIVERMKAAREKPIQLELGETPLAEVMALLTDSTGIAFSLQVSALDGLNIARDEPISLFTSEVPLRAALQAFEDAYPEMQFVLRDYGVLLTARDYSAAHGYAPVLEPSNELERPKKTAEKP